MLDDTIGEVILFDARAICHKYRANGSVTSTVKGRERIHVIQVVAFGQIEQNISAVWAAGA